MMNLMMGIDIEILRLIKRRFLNDGGGGFGDLVRKLIQLFQVMIPAVIDTATAGSCGAGVGGDGRLTRRMTAFIHLHGKRYPVPPFSISNL